MDNQILNSYSKISYLNVSRETCNELESLISMILRKNEEINIISKKSYQKIDIRERHIIDSAQIVDIIDLNSNTTSDLGTGGGMPGLIVAIVMKKLKNKMKIHLYEKSYHKCSFLKEVSKKFKLNTEIIQKDIFQIKKIVNRKLYCMPKTEKRTMGGIDGWNSQHSGWFKIYNLQRKNRKCLTKTGPKKDPQGQRGYFREFWA